MPPAPVDPRQNHLLAAIPNAEWERFAPHLVPVKLALGEVIYESGSDQPYVYFPTDSIVSLLYVMEDGASAEIAIVGNEGLVGISLFMGGGTTPEPRRRAKRRPRVPNTGPECSRRIRSRRAACNCSSCAIRRRC